MSKNKKNKKSAPAKGKMKQSNPRIKEIEEEIHTRLANVKRDILAVGWLLIETKKLFEEEGKKNDEFLKWAKQKFGLKRSAVYNFQNVPPAFEGREDEIVNLNNSVVFELSKKKMPEELKDAVIDNSDKLNFSQEDIKKLENEYENGNLDLDSDQGIIDAVYRVRGEKEKQHEEDVEEDIDTLRQMAEYLESKREELEVTGGKKVVYVDKETHTELNEALKRIKKALPDIKNVKSK